MPRPAPLRTTLRPLFFTLLLALLAASTTLAQPTFGPRKPAGGRTASAM